LHVNGKLIPVETTPGMMGEEDKGEWQRRWIHIFDTM
jgi:hypothetical protein